MPPTTLSVTGTFETPDGLVETGYIEFMPNTAPFVNAGVVVNARTVRANLDVNGNVAITLIRCAAGYTVTAYLGSGGVGSTRPSGPLSKVAQMADGAGPVDLSALTWA